MKKHSSQYFILLFGVIAAVMMTSSFAQTSKTFSDLSVEHLNSAAIIALQSKGIISGYPDGSFRPDISINRAEALKIILLGAGYNVPQISSNAGFTDVEANSWYAKYVVKAKELNIIEGYPDRTFKPYQKVNLVENLKILINANSVDLGNIIIQEDPYKDAYKNQWYSKYIAYAKSKNLVDADITNKIYPDRSLTRGGLAEILFRFILITEKTAPIPSTPLLPTTTPLPAPAALTTTTTTTTSTPPPSPTTDTPSYTAPSTTTITSTTSSTASSESTSATASASKIAKLLPRHLAIGLANIPEQLDWMKSSGVPWDYRYQYITGGVNTTSNWKTWNKPAGEFAARYMDESHKNGYIPILSYYQMEPSKPHNVDGEPDVNLNNTDTMKAYFEDWKLLLQKAGQFGKTVIIQHEPDLWGYMQQQHDVNPANTSVSVALSGFSEAAGYQNNAIGFAQLLVKLRDIYAPNALLGWHASHWASGNVFSDPISSATETAGFFNKLVANFDLIFHDPSDRDAGFKELVRKDGGKGWWDTKKFDNYLVFLAKMSSLTGRKGIVWQVPIGNTLYRTCNNTTGHYQDNRPQYFLEPVNKKNLVDYAQSGVIAILFGGGEEGTPEGRTTTYYDRRNDGITNPESITGNNLISVHADDDGGYLRLAATEYYKKGPVPLPFSN